jgi:hypothetical protein
MTTPADDTTVEDAFEAYLAGRPVPEEAAGLAVFAEAVRATATQPGRPNAALSELLATGLLTDQSSPSTRTATSAGTPPSRRASRTRNRRRFAMIFPALLAKLLSAGAVAQAATGAGVVLVAATGAGATGVLGDDVQDTIVGVVASDEETPQDESTDTTDTTDGVADDGTTVDPGAAEEIEGEESLPVEPVDEVQAAVEEWMAGPVAGASFGSWVSDMAGDPAKREWLRAHDIKFSDFVTKYAHRKGMTDEELAAELESEGVELDEPTTTAPEAEAEVEQPADDAEEPRTKGNGNGNGNGKAKGKGNDGNGGGRGNGRN